MAQAEATPSALLPRPPTSQIVSNTGIVDKNTGIVYIVVMATDQKRAATGGEMGANGEWYEGGKFIATKDNPKSAPVRFEPSAAQLQARADREAAEARLQAWLAARRLLLAEPIAALLAHGSADDLYENFYRSLGRQLSECGSLTRKQAIYAVKGVLGRQTKRNADQWDALLTSMTESYQ